MWVAKWQESDITIASAKTRPQLVRNLQYFLRDHETELKGKEITISIYDESVEAD